VHILIRTVTGRAHGEALETEYQADQLTLGSGGNNTVQLAGLSGQLRFTLLKEGRAQFSASGVMTTIGGKVTRKAVVSIGDQLQLPGYILEVIAPPQGFNFALQIEAQGVSYIDGMELRDRAWSMRRASWMGALLVLALCLVIPAMLMLWPERAAQLRDWHLPDDSLWSSGPLAGAHATAGVAKDCQACHRTPFVMVEDGACLACHHSINEHVDIGVHKAGNFSAVRCASCHREHNEPARLVRSDNAFCVDCHSEPERWKEGGEAMAPVTAFTAGGHPQFRLDLLTLSPQAAHGWDVQRQRQGEGNPSERSNLKFNHMVHLDGEKVHLESTREALSCNNCHVLEKDRKHFKPITMKGQCSSCHKLSYDSVRPDMELPHGNVLAASEAMEAHFIREFTDPVLRRDRASSTSRRIPGKREGATSCAGSGLDCGRAEARKEAQFQFAETGCVTCHEVTTDVEEQDMHKRWTVQPIRITQEWFRENHFDHRSHLNQASEKASKDPARICLSCHKANKSEAATDILVPGKDNCLQCHDEGHKEMSLTCVSCHAFHKPSGTASTLTRGTGPDLPHPPSLSRQEE
jgi:predicted CXXCH cytochrome family protein